MKPLLAASLIVPALWLGEIKADQSAPGAPHAGGVTVCGTLVGADGKPLIRGTVAVSRPVLPGSGMIKEDERLLGKQDLANSSHFCIASQRSGLLQVQAFGVNHNAADALIWAEPGSAHQISLALAAPTLREDLSAAKVVCYQLAPSFQTLDDAPFRRVDDGRYLAVIRGRDAPASCGFHNLTREICVATEPRGPDCIQGTQSAAYDLFRGFGIGRYSAVVTPVKGEARVYFDPAALPRGQGVGKIDFHGDGAATTLTAIWQSIRAREISERTGTSAAVAAADLTAAFEAARDEKAVIIRQARWADYLSMAVSARPAVPAHTAPEGSNLAAALRELAPASPFWPLVRTRLPNAVHGANMPSVVDGYAGEVVRGLAIPSERPLAINGIADAAHRRGDLATRNAWLAWLLRDYQGHYLARAAAEHYGLNDKVRVGKLFPEFAAPSLDNPTVTLTAKTIGARYLLVDFWATWCSPCIAELPSMQKAYDRFSGRGFRIMSYSLDETPDLVKQFRRGRFPMPWLHAMVPGRWDDMTDTFGLFGLPAPVLLDADGRVLATGSELLGGKLEALLERLLR